MVYIKKKNYNFFDYIIVGAGPAGLQLAYYLQKNMLAYIVLEKSNVPGSFFKQFPRHRRLISINKVYTGFNDYEINLRWDWNSLLSDNHNLLFKKYSKEYFPNADNLVDYLYDYADLHALNIKFNIEVINIEKNNYFTVTDQYGQRYTSYCVIIATGLYKPYFPKIKGIELVDLYNEVSVEQNKYCNKRILLIGKGNSAFETADNLVGQASSIHLISPNPIKMAWQTHYVGNLRAINNNILDTYHLKSQNAILDANIQSITKDNSKYIVNILYSHAEGEIETLHYDHVILCAGFRFDNNIFANNCMPMLCKNQKLPVQNSSWESINVEGLFFAGTLMQYLDYKKYMSGFIHGFRYNISFLSQILLARYQKITLPKKRLALIASELANEIIYRVNYTSGLWQQPGFLVDTISICHDENCAYYSNLLSLPYVLDNLLNRHLFIISLEFGKQEVLDAFNISRVKRDNIKNAHLSTFIHPIIKYYCNGVLVNEHHIIEDLTGLWQEDEHFKPLIGYLHEQLNKFLTIKPTIQV
jgi:thioredoxin reductase